MTTQGATPRTCQGAPFYRDEEWECLPTVVCDRCLASMPELEPVSKATLARLQRMADAGAVLVKAGREVGEAHDAGDHMLGRVVGLLGKAIAAYENASQVD